ncbi:hypothetical protein CMT92_05105 [Elizabethkingia anophelis]|nr:hypothetical protein [Elizabethkingia anophelis]
MNSIFILLIVFIIAFLGFIGLIFLIAFLASQSRKKKQEAVLATLPEGAKLKAIVRYNKGKQQTKILRMFIWHTSSGKPTTEQICNNLKSLQLEAV